MWGASNWNQPGQQQPNQWPVPMQSDDLAVRAAEWAKQRLAMENQSQQQSMQGAPLQQLFGTGGMSSQMHPPTIPTSLGSATDVLPPPLMGQPYPGSFTSQQPAGPPFGGGGKHDDRMDLDETRGSVPTVPPPLMGQQPVQGVHGLPQPDMAQYAPPQPPTPANPPPTQSYINEPSGSHYVPNVGQTSASFQPLPPPGGTYQPQVESKPPLLATPPNASYNPQMQVLSPESLYMQQGGQPFNQEQAYPGQGFISETILHPASDLKKKTLPAWVKEGLVKMYREKQKEEEKEAKLREMELTNRQSGGPRWSVDDDSESGGEGDKPAQDPPGEEMGDVDGSTQPRGILKKSVVPEATGPDSQHPEEEEESDSDSNVSYEGQTALSEEELLQKVRKMTIEVLLEVTGDELADVASEVLQEMRRSQTNEKPASSVHTRTLLGIGAYESDSSHSSGDDGGGSDDDGKNDQSLKLKKKVLTNPYSNLPAPRDVDGSLKNDTIQKAFNPDKQKVSNSNDASLPRRRTQDESGAKSLPQTRPQIVHQTALQRDPNSTAAGETKSTKPPPHRESSGDSGSSSSSSEAGPFKTGHRRGRTGRKRSRTRSNSRGERSTSRERRSLSKEQERGGFLSHAKGKKRRSRSRSKDRKRRSRSRSKDRKKRSLSRSRDRKRQSRSRSKDRKKLSRSRSKDRKRRSRSRSKDRRRRSRSGSKDRKRRSRSRSKDRRRRSRSGSKDRKRRSRSRSKDGRRWSRSGSKDRKRRSQSRSKDRRRQSRSKSKDRKRRSRSRSRDRQRRSLSRSNDRRRVSRSRSKDRRKRSRSRSMDRHRRSRSRSKDRHRRSQSRSRDGGRRSRSTSKDRRRRSQSRSKDRGKRSRSRSTDRQKHSPSWLKDTRSSRSRDTPGESHSKPSAEYMSKRDQQLLSPSSSLSKSTAPSSVKGGRDKASRDSKLRKHRHISSSSESESEALKSSSSSSSSSTSSSESSDNSSSGSIKKKKSVKEHISKKSKPAKSTKKVSTRKKRSPSLDTSRSSSRVSGRKKVKHSPPLRDRTHGRDKNGNEPRSASKKKKH